MEWLDNPLGAAKMDIEMTRPESMLEGMAKSVLESKLKQCQMENKVLKEEVKTLKATVKRLTLYNNSATIRKKNSNSWKTRRKNMNT